MSRWMHEWGTRQMSPYLLYVPSCVCGAYFLSLALFKGSLACGWLGSSPRLQVSPLDLRQSETQGPRRGPHPPPQSPPLHKQENKGSAQGHWES